MICPIREWRYQRGWSQTDLAILIDRAPTRISQIENGAQPFTPEMEALAEVFNKAPKELHEELRSWREERKKQLLQGSQVGRQ